MFIEKDCGLEIVLDYILKEDFQISSVMDIEITFKSNA